MAPAGGLTIALLWRALADEAGPVLRFVDDVRESTPIADLATVVGGRTAGEAAAAAADQLPGWLLTTQDAHLADLLLVSRGTLSRHSFLMQCDLRVHPGTGDPDPRFTVALLPDDPASDRWRAILPSWRAAFPPGHPDHFPGDDDLAIDFHLRLVDGSELGPLHRSTCLLLLDGRPVAGIVVNIRPQEPPRGGAWIADIWRDPSLHGTGVGHALMSHAKRLLCEDGHSSLSLVVTAGNPARRAYEAEGFTVVLESWTVQLAGSRRT